MTSLSVPPGSARDQECNPTELTNTDCVVAAPRRMRTIGVDMWFPVAGVFFAVAFVILAGRWAQALQRSHRLAATSLGIDYDRTDVGTLSEAGRLYRVDGYLEQELDLGRVGDPEAERWHRIARNRWWLLMIAVGFSGPGLVVSIVVEAQGTRIPVMPALPITIATWAVAVAVAGRILRADTPMDARRLFSWLGAIAAAGGFVLVASVVFGR